MNNNEIFKLVADLIGAVIAVLLAYLAPRFKAWLTVKVGEAQANEVYSDITILVQSAQQMYWNKTGAERKEYVLEQLTKLGYALTDEINAMIESAVFDMKKSEIKE